MWYLHLGRIDCRALRATAIFHDNHNNSNTNVVSCIISFDWALLNDKSKSSFCPVTQILGRLTHTGICILFIFISINVRWRYTAHLCILCFIYPFINLFISVNVLWWYAQHTCLSIIHLYIHLFNIYSFVRLFQSLYISRSLNINHFQLHFCNWKQGRTHG